MTDHQIQTYQQRQLIEAKCIIARLQGIMEVHRTEALAKRVAFWGPTAETTLAEAEAFQKQSLFPSVSA